MSWFAALDALVRIDIAKWADLRLLDLQFWHRGEARVVLVALLCLTLVLLIARTAFRPRAGFRAVVLPALPDRMRGSHVAFVRHFPALLFVAGVPFIVLALADPYSSLVSRQETFPGRRIALLIDASISMRTPFTAEGLNRRAATDSTFFTSIAAAERFVQLRRQGRYRDLVALVEFGNRAYVITPFTSDYENVLLGISLIGDPVEFDDFPDQGTVIAQGIQEGVELFNAFNFLDASGNLMVIFSDGEDVTVRSEEKSLDEILQYALDANVPVYFVRTNYGQDEGTLIPDELWKPAVDKTGGKFYAASDEASLVAAIEDIDRVSAGTIDIRMYSSQEPRFAFFALMASAFWVGAAALKLGVPHLQKLP